MSSYNRSKHELKISEYAFFCGKAADMAALTAKSPDELVKLKEESVTKEQDLYEEVCKSVSKWKKQAEKTISIERAQEYLQTPAVSHTSNKWTENEYDLHVISNKVYYMSWRVYERTTWDKQLEKSIPIAWELTWRVSFNTLHNADLTGHGGDIGGQDRKVFKSKAAMEKYLQGRIKAYSHLFTEICPLVPKEHQERFSVNGVLLPGYTVESPELLAPDKEAVDDLLSLLSDEDIGGEALEALPDPQPDEKTPESVWSRNRQKRQGASKSKQAPTR